MLKCKNKTNPQPGVQAVIYLSDLSIILAQVENPRNGAAYPCQVLALQGPVRDLNLPCLCPRAQDMVCSSAMLSFSHEQHDTVHVAGLASSGSCSCVTSVAGSLMAQCGRQGGTRLPQNHL